MFFRRIGQNGRERLGLLLFLYAISEDLPVEVTEEICRNFTEAELENFLLKVKRFCMSYVEKNK